MPVGIFNIGKEIWGKVDQLPLQPGNHGFADNGLPLPQGMGNSGFIEYKCPVTFEGSYIYCELASDPLIAVSRANEIAKRSVAKPRDHEGTIKESWAVGDWQVTISGIIVAETKEELNKAVMQIDSVCMARESVKVTCPALNDVYGITRLAIERLDLPFTPGELNQQFTITALSDTSHELLEEL